MPDPNARPTLALALQGGGAHGAYGWGVLERLLEEDIDIVAVSGASAGALNGAALVAGMAEGGRPGAIAALERLWGEVSRASPLTPFDVGQSVGTIVDPVIRRWLEFGRLVGPYISSLLPQLRSMAALRRIASDAIDLRRLAQRDTIPLYVSATRVATGEARVFSRGDVTLDALMASACLPDLFAAVSIDGEDFWDGGFSANPALEPLIFNGHGASDVLIVQITPFQDEEFGMTVSGIMGRVSDIGFNACLMRDLKALQGIKDLLVDTPAPSAELQALKAINLHLLTASPELTKRGAASKLDTRLSKLEDLRALGRAVADAWLAESRIARSPDDATPAERLQKEERE